jgi:hypothetical protein
MLAVVITAVLAGHFKKAARLCMGYVGCLALYVGAVVVVSLVSPQRVVGLGQERRFDDWCITVDDATPSGPSTQRVYTVTLRITNRARRVSQQENGVSVYVIDEKGWRFDAVPDPCALPINVRLEPGQSVTAVRTFETSTASGRLGLVVGRDGLSRLPGMFIISDDSSLLHKPTITRLPD